MAIWIGRNERADYTLTILSRENAHHMTRVCSTKSRVERRGAWQLCLVNGSRVLYIFTTLWFHPPRIPIVSLYWYTSCWQRVFTCLLLWDNSGTQHKKGIGNNTFFMGERLVWPHQVLFLTVLSSHTTNILTRVHIVALHVYIFVNSSLTKCLLTIDGKYRRDMFVCVFFMMTSLVHMCGKHRSNPLG